MNNPDISVIIPCRNEAKYIGSTLQSIFQQTFDLGRVEILILDGISADETLKILDEYSFRIPNIKIVENNHLITASGRNIGIRMSRGKFIALIDGHCEISPDYLSTCCHVLQKSSDDIVCVAGRTRAAGRRFVGSCIALAMSSSFGVGNASFRCSEKEMDVDTASFGVYRRSIFEKTGGYDEKLMYAEDDEMSFRITSKGYRIRLLPHISARYWVRDTYRDLIKQYFNYGKGKMLLFQKHHKLPSLRALVPPVFVIALVLGFFGGFLLPNFLWLWIGMLFVYILLGLAVPIATMKCSLLESLAVFWAFVCMHVSYGSGILVGFAKWILHGNIVPKQGNDI